MHLGFQEYLAAREIRSRGFADTGVLKELAAHFGESWWQEVGLLLLALEDPSLFVPYMREVVKLPQFAEHSQLVDACLEDAAEVSSLPFVELLREGPGTDPELWRRQSAALRIVERIDEGALGELSDVLRRHPDGGIGERFKTRLADAQRAVLVASQGGYELVPIPEGSFTMGSPASEEGRYDDEGPQHRVTLSAFAMGRYPVTNEQYAAFLEQNSDAAEPEYWGDRQFSQPRQPVVGVSWEEARRYAEWAGLRLPTEAEWEYACRGGTTSAYNDGSECTEPGGEDPALDRLGWYDENGGDQTHPVGEKEPNAWGLYDMHGNVWEWCADGRRDYSTEPQTEPRGPEDARARRVVRGGSYWNRARICRSADRDAREPGGRDRHLGFRLASGQPGSAGKLRRGKAAGGE